MKSKGVIIAILASFYLILVSGCDQNESKSQVNQKPIGQTTIEKIKKDSPEALLISWDDLTPLDGTKNSIIDALEKEGITKSTYSKTEFSNKVTLFFHAPDQSKELGQYIKVPDEKIKADAELNLYWSKDNPSNKLILAELLYLPEHDNPRNRKIISIINNQLVKGGADILTELFQDNYKKINENPNKKVIYSRKEFNYFTIQLNTIMEKPKYSTPRITTFSVLKQKNNIK